MIEDGMNERVEAMRLRRGESKSAFAAALDDACSVMTVTRWECGGSYPNWFYTLRLAELCRVPLDWLLYGNNTKNYSIARYGYTALKGDTVGKRIKELRDGTGIGRGELSRALETSFTALVNWEQDRCAPSLYFIDRLTDGLHASVDTLAGKETYKNGLPDIHSGKTS